jgi:hypothetical protein
MQRLRRAAFPLALVAALAAALIALVDDSVAELDNAVFTSRDHQLRLIVPRGWRASDYASYPGLLLWMAPAESTGQIELTAEIVDDDLYCSWPASCRAIKDGLASQYACALRARLEALRFKVGPVVAGPKENEAAGLTSVSFEYEDRTHFLRHAIASPAGPKTDEPTSGDRAISVVLSAPTSEARAALTRGFEQALRSLRLLSAEETARAVGIDAAIAVPGDGSLIDASTITDGAVLDAGIAFQSAPALPARRRCPVAGARPSR